MRIKAFKVTNSQKECFVSADFLELPCVPRLQGCVFMGTICSCDSQMYPRAGLPRSLQ